MNDNGLKFLHIGEGAERRAIAVRAQEGAPPGLLWLGGYKSDMKGAKAEALADWAARQRRACVRFDYSGHGESEGAFTDGTIGRWLAESLRVFDAYAAARRSWSARRWAAGSRSFWCAPCSAGARSRRRVPRRRPASPAWCWSRRRWISPRN